MNNNKTTKTTKQQKQQQHQQQQQDQEQQQQQLSWGVTQLKLFVLVVTRELLSLPIESRTSYVHKSKNIFIRIITITIKPITA